MICLGQEFRPGRMVCILKPSDTEYPAVFGEIQHVIIVEDLKYLAAQCGGIRVCLVASLNSSDETHTTHTHTTITPATNGAT